MPDFAHDTRNLVAFVLKNATCFEWTHQGFGMLRTYIGDGAESRITIWHSALKTPNVSDIHDHPWEFESTVIVGKILNHHYNYCKASAKDSIPVYRGEIRPGVEGHGPVTKEAFHLQEVFIENVYAGDSYKQNAPELHRTDYDDSTVTLCRRYNRTQEDSAFSFWHRHLEWVSARPYIVDDKSLIYHHASLALSLF